MKYLIDKDGGFYKANLHCHSTCSDGRFTPEELKAMYTEKGYSIIAYTDHGRLIPHDDLTDESFLALNGLELGLVDAFEYLKNEPGHLDRKNSDIGLIAPKGVYEKPPYTHFNHFSPKVVNDIRRAFRDAGFFVIHNHPTWSLETYDDYMAYDTPHALEIVNTSAFRSGAAERNENIYEDMLLAGKRLYCIAADDNHNKPPRPDSFGAWTVIKAPELEYGAVMDALFRGSFYASEGPEIKELYVDDDNRLHVTTSPAVSIRIMTNTRTRKLTQNQDGTPVTETTFKITEAYEYFRIVVTDSRGRQAFSNAYFTDDILA